MQATVHVKMWKRWVPEIMQNWRSTKLTVLLICNQSLISLVVRGFGFRRHVSTNSSIPRRIRWWQFCKSISASCIDLLHVVFCWLPFCHILPNQFPGKTDKDGIKMTNWQINDFSNMLGILAHHPPCSIKPLASFKVTLSSWLTVGLLEGSRWNLSAGASIERVRQRPNFWCQNHMLQRWFLWNVWQMFQIIVRFHGIASIWENGCVSLTLEYVGTFRVPRICLKGAFWRELLWLNGFPGSKFSVVCLVFSGTSLMAGWLFALSSTCFELPQHDKVGTGWYCHFRKGYVSSGLKLETTTRLSSFSWVQRGWRSRWFFGKSSRW